jgi:hypothetical protein
MIRLIKNLVILTVPLIFVGLTFPFAAKLFFLMASYSPDIWVWVCANMWGTNCTWFWTMVQAIAVVVTLIIINLQLRIHRNANLLDTFATLENRWNSQYMLQARRKVCDMHDKDQKLRIGGRLALVLDFFEDIGFYLDRKVLDHEVVWHKWSQTVEYYWLMFKPHIERFRKETGYKSWYGRFESLNQMMAKIAKKEGIPFGTKSKADIDKFVSTEIEQ